MSAIRCYFHCGTTFYLGHHSSKRPVEILLKSGEYQRMEWIGFICEKGLDFICHDGFVKMAAAAVSPSTGDCFIRDWRELDKGEHVLAAKTKFKCYRGIIDGVYGVVDRSGTPIIVAPGRLKKAPSLKAVS